MPLSETNTVQTPDQIADRVCQALAGCRFDLTNEKRLQWQIAQRLEQIGIGFEPEFRLSRQDVPDFLIDGLVVECKLKDMSKRNIYRQLKRYAVHDRVAGVLLVTNVPMGLPELIEGKPTFFFSLGRGWL